MDAKSVANGIVPNLHDHASLGELRKFMRPATYYELRNDLIRQAYLEWATTAEIAAETGLQRSMVKIIVKGLHPIRRDKRNQRIYDLFMSGLLQREVAEVMGLSLDTIHSVCARMGYSRNGSR